MIRLENVTVQYTLFNGESITAVRNFSCQFAPGELVAVLGRNGSGKSTLARLCNGLVLPSEGTVRVDDLAVTPDDPSAVAEIRRRVGMVFQNPDNQLVAATVEREIAFGLENLGIDYAEMHRRVEDALDRFDLQAYRRHPPHRLSGGEKQRVALAAITAMQPHYLILDEPTSLLDYRHRKRLLADLQSMAQDIRHPPFCIIYITQFPVEALLANRVIVLHQGELYCDGPPIEVFQQVERFERIGIEVPLEFPVYKLLRDACHPINSIEDLILRPIL